MKQVVFDLLNGVMHAFDETSLGGENLKVLYELAFFCMHDNEAVSERVWRLCQLADRDNVTILFSYALETFPVSFVVALTFFALVAKASPSMCKQTFAHLTCMEQFCEYVECLRLDDYVAAANGADAGGVRLIRNRKVFGALFFAAFLTKKHVCK